jgi:hypothetical protein
MFYEDLSISTSAEDFPDLFNTIADVFFTAHEFHLARSIYETLANIDQVCRPNFHNLLSTNSFSV